MAVLSKCKEISDCSQCVNAQCTFVQTNGPGQCLNLVNARGRFRVLLEGPLPFNSAVSACREAGIFTDEEGKEGGDQDGDWGWFLVALSIAVALVVLVFMGRRTAIGFWKRVRGFLGGLWWLMEELPGARIAREGDIYPTIALPPPLPIQQTSDVENDPPQTATTTSSLYGTPVASSWIMGYSITDDDDFVLTDDEGYSLTEDDDNY